MGMALSRAAIPGGLQNSTSARLVKLDAYGLVFANVELFKP